MMEATDASFSWISVVEERTAPFDCAGLEGNTCARLMWLQQSLDPPDVSMPVAAFPNVPL